jgi:hypothetical protein
VEFQRPVKADRLQKWSRDFCSTILEKINLVRGIPGPKTVEAFLKSFSMRYLGRVHGLCILVEYRE